MGTKANNVTSVYPEDLHFSEPEGGEESRWRKFIKFEESALAVPQL